MPTALLRLLSAPLLAGREAHYAGLLSLLVASDTSGTHTWQELLRADATTPPEGREWSTADRLEQLDRMSPKELRLFIGTHMPGQVSKALGGKALRRTKADIVSDIMQVAQGRGGMPRAATPLESARTKSAQHAPATPGALNSEATGEVAQLTLRLQQQLQQSRAAIDMWAARVPPMAVPAPHVSGMPGSASPFTNQRIAANVGWVAAAMIGGTAVAAVANIPLATPDVGDGATGLHQSPREPSCDDQDPENVMAAVRPRITDGGIGAAGASAASAHSEPPAWYAEAKVELDALSAPSNLARPWSGVYQAYGEAAPPPPHTP